MKPSRYYDSEARAIGKSGNMDENRSKDGGETLRRKIDKGKERDKRHKRLDIKAIAIMFP